MFYNILIMHILLYKSYIKSNLYISFYLIYDINFFLLFNTENKYIYIYIYIYIFYVLTLLNLIVYL